MKHDGELTPQEEPSSDPGFSGTLVSFLGGRTADTQLSLQLPPLTHPLGPAYTFSPRLSPGQLPYAGQELQKLNCVLHEEDGFHFKTDSWFIGLLNDVNIMPSCVWTNRQ